MHPMQKDCDPNNPKEFAAWCFAAGIPDVGVREGNYIPNLIVPQLTAGVSEMLWHFGFRHHPELQRKWIKGGGGFGCVAQIVDYEPEDWLPAAADEFLKEHNPKLREAIKKAPESEKEKLRQRLRENFEQLRQLMDMLEE